MDYIACIILAFALLQLLVALVNLLFREHLPPREAKSSLPTSAQTLSLLIPARDEEANIGRLLGDLTTISDRIMEIIICDDQSADHTAAIVETFAARDPRIRLIRSGLLPGDWNGKNHACHRLAQEAVGDYLLFLDADVRLGEGVIDRSLQYMQQCRCDLMSIFPAQEMHTLGEKITVPNMQLILLTLLPLPLVRLSKYPSLSAANGQFMLFRGDTYRELEPHRRFRKSRAEDIEIARHLKRLRRRVSCLTGERDVRCRMYHSLPEAVEGFSKNVTYFFGNSLAAAILYWLVTTTGFIAFLLAGRWDWLWLWLVATLLTRIAVSLTAKMKVIDNLLLCPLQQIMLGAFLLRHLLNERRKAFIWKGRSI